MIVPATVQNVTNIVMKLFAKFMYNWKAESRHLVINVGDVHCIEHVKVKVIFEHSSQYVKGNVWSACNEINHNIKGHPSHFSAAVL